ncbi:MAG: efflux RND transporter periplasmic adaptor subunit [Acidobacteriota bacterium]|nr:efflux RND transporter periplasmic adaptor subunit [Acidobacteriota bacterium]
MKKIIIRVVVLLVLLGAGWGVYAVYKQLPQRQQLVPVAKVLRGDVVIRAYSRGELRAVRSATLTAPNLFSTVQVTRLAPLGSLAHEKDLIVEFDDSERRASLDETLLEVDQTDEQIKKSQADLAIRTNQDQVDLLKAKYSVRRAELEVKRNPLLSEIDAKKNVLNLEESRRRLSQLESDIKSRQEQALAEIAVLRAQRAKSMIDVARENQRIAQAKVLSPMTGLVAVRQNRGQGFFFPGMQLPDIREGDTLQPGMPVADVLDLSELEVVARVGELDRANLHEGQEVSIHLDAVPDKKFRGKIKNMSGTASSNIFSGDPAKKFDVVFAIDMRQLLTGLGASSEQVRQIMETAERNAKRAPAPPQGAAMAAMMAKMKPGAPPPPPGARMPAAPPKPAGPPPPTAAPGGAASNADLMRFAAAAASTSGTEEERARAKLPPPPEEDSQLNVLLRPGLLADVEIIVEKIPDAIHVPNQAIFEKNGQQYVFARNGKRFEERPVKIAKRSETATVIAQGLKPGETIALADPNATKVDGKSDKKSGGPMSGMPAGGAKGGK